jgi:hypothetical protein
VSQPAASGRPRRLEWLLAGLAALVVFTVPMTVIGWLDNPAPEVRVLASPERLSALVIDGDARVLIVNTDDREGAVALLGRIAQPWETKPVTVIAPAEDGAAIGLWEVLQRLDPVSVVVAGVPGADPLWSAIDAECARRGIDLRYISDRASLPIDRIELMVFGVPPEQAGTPGVVIHRGDVSVAVAFDATPPPVEAQALVLNGDPAPATPDLLVTSDDSPRSPARHELLVGDLRYARLVIEEDAVRVFGGVLRSPAPRVSS